MWRNFKFLNVTDVEESQVSSHVAKFQIVYTRESNFGGELPERKFGAAFKVEQCIVSTSVSIFKAEIFNTLIDLDIAEMA